MIDKEHQITEAQWAFFSYIQFQLSILFFIPEKEVFASVR